MKRTIPLLITAAAGFVLIVSFFIPVLQPLGEDAAVWFDILASIAFVLGGGNLLKLQLQKISDRQAGWGYSAVTLAAFLITLGLGLFKFGCPPEQHVEYFGQSFVPVSLESLPEFRVSGEIPRRGDGEPLPASVRRQLFQSGDEIVFRGWLRPDQAHDLSQHSELLGWKVLVEDLAGIAQPPVSLRGKVQYLADHGVLAFQGFMTKADENALRDLFSARPEMSGVLDRLAEQARREASVTVRHFPSGFAIPASAAEFVERTQAGLLFRGPMSPGQRDAIASTWSGFPFTRPLNEPQQLALVAEIESRGKPLNSEQRAAALGVDDEQGNPVKAGFFDLEWSADQLIQHINNAGVSPGSSKSWKEIQQEILAGTERPERSHPAPAPVELNADQRQFVEQFVAQANLGVEQLIAQLSAAGPLTDRQKGAIESFFGKLPTVADQRKTLCFLLLEHGPLSREQQDFLLSGVREQHQWRRTVGELFLAAHRTKFPWSGDYAAQGSPFWWIYEYVFQPLLTTTFAVLAFYVASAAFRAFRAKNLEATLLLGTAFIILLGRTFAGAYLSQAIPDSLSALRIDQMTVYIMSIFNTAGNRAIMIGIALGIASTSLKVLLGIDRSYLGSGDD